MYFPKAQIKPNLYTNGEELVYKENLNPYIGYYFSVSSGKFYTGAYPSNSSIELIKSETPEPDILINVVNPYESDFTPVYGLDEDQEFTPPTTKSYVIGGNLGDRKNQRYMDLTSIPKIKTIPIPYNSKLTAEEATQEEYFRYFAKSNSQNIYTEIDKISFEKFSSQDPTVAFKYYTVTFLVWSLKNNSFETNKNMVLLKEKNLNWYNFHQFFKGNFGNFPNTTSGALYTKGGEFLLPNRTNYIGYYHIMDNGGFMVGKYHGDGPEIRLISLNNTPTLNTPQSTSNTSTSGGGGGGY